MQLATPKSRAAELQKQIQRQSRVRYSYHTHTQTHIRTYTLTAYTHTCNTRSPKETKLIARPILEYDKMDVVITFAKERNTN